MSMTNDELAHKLRYFAFLSYSSEQESNYLAKKHPVVFQAADILLANVTDTFTKVLGNKLTEEVMEGIKSDLKACALLGICIFEERFHFSKQLNDVEAQKTDLLDLEYIKTREPSPEEIVKSVTDAMEKGKKLDVIEKTPEYVMLTLSNITTELLARMIEAKITDNLTEKEIEFLHSGLYYILSDVYFCGIVYVYLVPKPANNALQNFVKKSFKIK